MDYTFSYKDIVYEGYDTGHKALIDQFNKANLGGLLGLDIDFSNKCYLELDYNPTFTKSYNYPFASYQDNCWDIKLGININKLIKK